MNAEALPVGTYCSASSGLFLLRKRTNGIWVRVDSRVAGKGYLYTDWEVDTMMNGVIS